MLPNGKCLAESSELKEKDYVPITYSRNSKYSVL